MLCSCIAAAGAAAALLPHAGEVDIAGPCPAQAVVAGHSTGFLLLVILRIITKLALPATREGTRMSVCIYFSATGLLVLSALLAYLCVLRPAVQAAASDRLEARWARQHSRKYICMETDVQEGCILFSHVQVPVAVISTRCQTYGLMSLGAFSSGHSLCEGVWLKYKKSRRVPGNFMLPFTEGAPTVGAVWTCSLDEAIWCTDVHMHE
jgi:hypothetical protein